MTNLFRGRLLASTLLVATAATAPAFAQTVPAETQNPDSTTGRPQSNDAAGRPAEVEPLRGAGGTETGTIIVTGSRVARPNATSPVPITTVGQEDIKEFGATRVEDLTNSLPQVFAGQSSGVSNGADGTATIDLRGLTPSRTLTLIDGRRLMPGGIGGFSGADLNFIPGPLVSSIDLLTGGASSTYGADAVAGVVNFKMNRNFRGVRFDGQYSLQEHRNKSFLEPVIDQRFTTPKGHTVNGGAYEATMIVGAGTDDDRGSIVAYASYRADSAITQDRYDYSTCTLNPDANNVGFACGGSGTPANPRFGGLVANAPRTQLTTNGVLQFNPTTGAPILASPFRPGTFTLDPVTNALRPFVTADQFNFAPANYYRRPSERFNAGAFASFEISPAIKPYLDVMFSDYTTDAQIAPSGVFFGTRSVNCDNPLLLSNPALASQICLTPGATLGAPAVSTVGTPAVSSISIGKRNIEGGPRSNQIQFTQYRIVAGIRGDLNDAISYDGYYQVGQIRYNSSYRNDVSNSRIDNALNVRNVGGVPTCVVGATTTPVAGCVPYNIFNANGITPAAAGYINIPLIQTGTTREEVVNGSMTFNLSNYGFTSPFAKDGLRLALGAEYRTESLFTQPDLAFQTNEGAGQGSPTLPIDGRYSVRDFYGELGVPLVTDRRFFNDLSLQLGYRNSNYNVRGATRQNKADTYKIAANWSFVPSIAIRGSYNRAVRSPNLNELFQAQQVALFSGSDPCAGAIGPNGTVNGFTFAQCARTGVTQTTYGQIGANSANQYNQFIGGNVNLTPEKADTYTAGVVVKPQILGGNLVFSADYFNIKVANAVGTAGAQVILTQCLATGDPTYCSLINRGSAAAGGAAGTLYQNASGTPLGFVNNFTINTGSIKTSGVDLNGDFRTRIGENRIRAQFIGTYLDKYKFQPLTGGADFDCAGLFGQACGAPNPHVRFNTNVKLTTANDFGITVRWRYLGPTTNEGAAKNPILNSEAPNPADNGFPALDRRIGAYNYFDLLFTLPISTKAVFRVGVNNITDKDPPIVSQASLAGTVGNGNTFPGTYDALGRFAFVNLTADF